MSYARTARIPSPRSAERVPVPRREKLDERRLEPPRQPRRVGAEREQARAGARVELLEKRQDPLADQPALRRRRCDASTRQERPSRAAVRLGLLAPERQQRPHDAVLAPRADPAGRAARDDPVEHRLDLIRGRVPGGAQARLCGQGVSKLAQLRLGVGRRRLDDAGAERLGAVGSASASASAPRRPWWTWTAPTSVPELRGATCQRHVESAPPETRQVTSPPGSIRAFARTCASTRSSTSTSESVPARGGRGARQTPFAPPNSAARIPTTKTATTTVTAPCASCPSPSICAATAPRDAPAARGVGAATLDPPRRAFGNAQRGEPIEGSAGAESAW